MLRGSIGTYRVSGLGPQRISRRKQPLSSLSSLFSSYQHFVLPLLRKLRKYFKHKRKFLAFRERGMGSEGLVVGIILL